MNETIGYQNTGEKIMKSKKEHNHNLSLSHEHDYDVDEENEHKHIVNDDDINGLLLRKLKKNIYLI